MDPRTNPSPLVNVALLCPVSVGVVAWSAPEPTLTVVVKVTLTLPEDGAARLAEQQEPLSLDEQGALGEPGDLDRASDFAPLKARTDILLAGHAYATSPMHVLSAGFAVDKLRKRFYALAAEPSAQTPLYPRYLRATPGAEGATVQVGARAVWAGGDPAASLVSRDGVPAGVFSRGFDYGLFNVAPADQQVGLLPPGARLVLEGLVPGGDRRMVRLPGARPRVLTLPPEGLSGARSPEETPLRCDTLWIDAGHERCTLTFRGVLAPSPGGAPPTLLVAMDFGSERQSWPSLRAELERARWTHAATPESTRALAQRGAPPPPRPIVRRSAPTLNLSQLTQLRDAAGEIDARLAAPLPFQPTAATSAVAASAPPVAASAPFAPAPRAPAPTMLLDEDSAGPPSVTRIGFVLPDASVPAAALPFQPAVTALPFQSAVTVLPFQPAAAALPFQPAASPPLAATMSPEPAPAAPLARFPAPEETRLVTLDPAPAAAPPPEAPRPRHALLPLETYAAIKAASWAGASLEAALRERGVDEIAWYSNERQLAEALAAEAAEGKRTLSQELRRALKAAQARPTPAAGALPAPEPLRRRVQKERAPRAAKRMVARPAQ